MGEIEIEGERERHTERELESHARQPTDRPTDRSVQTTKHKIKATFFLMFDDYDNDFLLNDNW